MKSRGTWTAKAIVDWNLASEELKKHANPNSTEMVQLLATWQSK